MRIALWGNTALITAWRNLLLPIATSRFKSPQSSGFPALPLRRGACHRRRLRAIRWLFASTTVNVPVVPTLMGWGAIPDDHVLVAGMVGLQTIQNP
jgi:hypothetical protein